MVHFSLALSAALLVGLSRAQFNPFGPQSCVNADNNPEAYAAILLSQDELSCFCIPPGGYGYPITVSVIAPMNVTCRDTNDLK
jgi:hypothetical protein